MDIQASALIFKKLYSEYYDTILCVIYANASLYSSIDTLQTLNMKDFNPGTQKTISAAIDTAICYDDPRVTPPPYYPPGEDRSCNCKSEHLWLDVTVIIDNSKSMTQAGLSTVASHVVTLFGSYTTLNQSLDQSIRLAIISVSNNATVVADFNAINSPNDAVKYMFDIQYDSEKIGVNIADALSKAADLITSQGKKRDNARKVVLIYTSAFNKDGYDDPVPIANQLLSSGIFIIGVEFIQSDEGSFVQNLSAITSPNMTFSNVYKYNPLQKDLLNITIDALCWSEFVQIYILITEVFQ